MDQNWVAVDLDERVCLHGGGRLTDKEWFWGDPGSILDALCVPDTDKSIDSLLTLGRAAVQRSPLFRLPPELFDQIFHQITLSSGTYDARLLLLALTCKALLACARRHIVRLQTRHHAPLAGHRLICIGNGATALEDYPSGLLTPIEEKTLMVGEESGEEIPRSLYAHAMERWRRQTLRGACPGPAALGSSGSGCGSRMASLADLMYRPSAVSRMSMEDFLRFQALTTPSYGAAGEASQPALCNLSKQEYVCLAGADGLCGTVGDLWHVLLACICWTSSRSVANEADEDGAKELWRGRWAGDRFAVRTLDSTITAGTTGCFEGGERWTDVTDETIRLVKCLQTRCDVATSTA